MKSRTGPLMVILVALTVVACGANPDSSSDPTTDSGGSSVNTTLTQATARQHIHDYLTQTLGQLPAEMSLSAQHPVYPRAGLSGGTTVPCDDNAPAGTGPVTLGVSYWVLGVDPAQTAKAQDQVVAVWEASGWTTDRPDPTYVRAVTPDDYAFTVTDNGQGDLAISASSPCFSRDGVDRQPMPADIPHPA